MPIYEYQCKKCGEFEHIQRITDAPLSKCPTCRGKVTKLISNTSFQLKGSGWYITDYGRSGSTTKAGGTESKSESKSESSTADSKSDTSNKKADGKPAGKTGKTSSTQAAA